MRYSLLSSTPPREKTPGISLLGALMLIGTVGLTQQVSALDVFPGSTEYFGSAESSESNSEHCDSPPNICGASATSNKAGAYAFSIFSTTQRARQKSELIKSFSVPKSDLGSEPVDTVLDARVTGNVKWRGTLWTLDLSKFGNVTIPALGPTADAFIRVSLVDVTDTDQRFEAGNASIADFHCDPIDRELGVEMPVPLASDGVDIEFKVGWCEEHSEDSFNFGAKVIQGHHYELRLTMICQAITGAVPTLLSACSFNDTAISYNLKDELENGFKNLTDGALNIKIPDIPINMPSATFPLTIPPEEVIGIAKGDLIDETITINIPNTKIPGFTIPVSDVFTEAVQAAITSFVDALVPSIDDGYLEWDYMTVTIDPDVTGLLRSAKKKILTEVGGVQDDIEIVRKGVRQSINLLHTPQGKRETPILDGYPDLCGDGNCNWGERP